MSSLVLYLIGFVILAAGALVGAHDLHVQERWLWVMGLVMTGFGVLTDVTSVRRRDAPAASEPHA